MPSAAPILGNAGSMVSIANAFNAIIAEIRQTNSTTPGPEDSAVATERLGIDRVRSCRVKGFMSRITPRLGL